MEQQVTVIISDTITVHIVIVGKTNWTREEAIRMALTMFIPVLG